jgi:hypothetical protein
MHGPEALIWTRASMAKGRERPHLFARPAARKATRGRSRPFLSRNALCTRPRWMSTAASKYKLNRTAHRSPRNIVQVGRAFFLCRILPTSCPLVEIEGHFFPWKPTHIPETAWDKSKSGVLACELERSMRRPNTLFETNKIEFSPSHFRPFAPLYK